jgi:hypothetical protein
MNATPKQIRAKFREVVQSRTARMNAGEMMEPYNGQHFVVDCHKAGIDTPNPSDLFAVMAWFKANGLGRLAVKLAREGHLIKGTRRGAF